MGCCVSKQQDLYIDIPRAVSTTDTWALRQKSFLGGCKLLPFTASCPASYPYQSLTRVVLGEGHLFAALWEGHGGSQAARHCVSNCYEMLLECLQSNPDPCWALRQTTQLLDKSYFASELPDDVKAGVGATGIMVYLNTQTNQCCIARLGDALPFLAASKGSFNTTSVDVKPLSSSKAHRVLFSELGSRDQQASSSSSRRSAAYAVTDTSAGLSTYTHAVGLGYGKAAKLQQLWLKQESTTAVKQHMQRLPFISNNCEVNVCQLSQGDETLVLASEGLLQVLPAQEVGLMLHHFNAAKLNALKQALTAAASQAEAGSSKAAGSKGGRGKARAAKDRSSKEPREADEAVAAAGKAARHPNVANIVMHHALTKALDKHNVMLEKQQQQQQLRDQQQHGARQEQQPLRLSYSQLTHLPLEVDKEAFRPPGAKGSNVQLHLPKHYPTAGLCKRDVHGDMGMVVVSLNWPRSHDSQPMPGLSPQRPGRTVSRPDAQYRWQLLRLAVKFHLAYRRTLRGRWWELVGAAGVAAEEAARQAEVQAWKTMGTAVKVNLAGDVLDPETPLRPRHSPLKAPHQPSPTKKRTAPIGSSTLGPSCSSSVSTPPRASAAAAASSSSPMRSSAAGAAVTATAPRASSSGKPAAPARLQIGTSFEQDDCDESDVESPSRLDSPSKAAKSAAAAAVAAAAAAALPVKKPPAASPSPTKAYNKQSLSLRSSRNTPGGVGGEGGFRVQQGLEGRSSPAPAAVAAEPSWGTCSASRSSTPGQLLRPSRSSMSGTPPAGKVAGGSPVKGSGRGPPGGIAAAAAGKDVGPGSSSGYDYSGYHAAGYSGVTAGRGASPTKLSRKISLRKPASHY